MQGAGAGECNSRPQKDAFKPQGKDENYHKTEPTTIMNQALWKTKQILKMTVQHILLPLMYRFWRAVFRKNVPELIIFADAHHVEIPFSMEVIHTELEHRGFEITDIFRNYSRLSAWQSFKEAAAFMRLYAQAKYVFICDNFLPVASCKKSSETTVVQLWHSCGLLKKMGYDTGEDVPKYYLGNVYKNYDLVTVSAPCCIGPLTHGMNQKLGIVQALGVSRTDIYFDKVWCGKCREEFYGLYPDAKDKRVILWAPTFRGNAANPVQEGTEVFNRLEQQLGSEYMLIRKVHPYVDQQCHLSNCPIPTERLLPIADLMITDYSSVVFDYLIFKKPFILFAPDLEEYQKKRGFYVEYFSLSPYVALDGDELEGHIRDALHGDSSKWIENCCSFHLASCDGNATERIIEWLGM